MFYPFRSLADLKIEESYWKYISQQLQSHLEHEKIIFWHKGFDILQNINDRMTLEKDKPRIHFLTTKNEKPDTKSQQEKWQKENNKRDILQMGLKSR